ncbi:SPJ_0845 family protein [Ligilactobacillus sp. LYQ60]
MGLKITRDANLDKLFDQFAIGPDDQKRGKDERKPKTSAKKESNPKK